MASCPFLSLEALDGRFEAREDVKAAAPVSRWKTWEYRFYAVMFCIVVPIMVKTVMSASNETNPNYPKFERYLSQGWLFGRKVDNSDQQYRFFRDNFALLLGFVGCHKGLRYLSECFGVERRTFDLGFGLLFLAGMHGFNSLKILFHVMVMFAIGRFSAKNKIGSQCLLWVYGIGTLFLNDRYRLVSYGIEFMDNFKGLITRWDVFFNFTLLRMLSFNLDYIRAQAKVTNDIPLNTVKAKSSEESASGWVEPVLNERERLDYSSPLNEYSLFNYLAYLFYTPLFIVGPIITFNDYMYQTKRQLPSINVRAIALYGLRLIFCFMTMEFVLHYMYVVAVSKAKAWQGDTPFQISMIGLFNLNIIWMKLLIPWRLFRFWALCDGIDPPENMIRCMDNNFSAVQFWRAWHRSFNKWIIRYIYVPMGGTNYRILGSLAVFSFVAIWHDIELRLLIWGWVVVLFLLPELIVTNAMKPFRGQWWFRHACALGAVVNIWMMMLANLYGFCLGHDGMLLLLNDMFATFDGLVFFVTSSICLFIAAQVMFELREGEKRRGISVKC